jgi:glutathione S-transferase
MSKPKLIYFDVPVSRGEECRLALHLAGIDFDDVRIKPADWPALKDQTPYGSLPVLEWPGSPPRRDDAARGGPARECIAHPAHG